MIKLANELYDEAEKLESILVFSRAQAHNYSAALHTRGQQRAKRLWTSSQEQL